MEQHDPYASGFRVLDTDYDNYLFVYHCLEKDEDKEAQLDGLGDEDVEARRELAEAVLRKLGKSRRYSELLINVRESLERGDASERDL